MVTPATPLPLPLDFSAYLADALSLGWFLSADAAQTVGPGPASLALHFQIAITNYPLMAGANVDLAKAEFDKVRSARSDSVTPLKNIHWA